MAGNEVLFERLDKEHIHNTQVLYSWEENLISNIMHVYV
jgi:hypothetical protein